MRSSGSDGAAEFCAFSEKSPDRGPVRRRRGLLLVERWRGRSGKPRPKPRPLFSPIQGIFDLLAALSSGRYRQTWQNTSGRAPGGGSFDHLLDTCCGRDKTSFLPLREAFAEKARRCREMRARSGSGFRRAVPDRGRSVSSPYVLFNISAMPTSMSTQLGVVFGRDGKIPDLRPAAIIPCLS